MVRRTLLVLLVGMLLTGLSSLSYAQEGGAKPEKAAKGQPTKIEQALAKLTLTEEQKGKIDPIVAEYKEKTKTAEIADRKKLHDETCEKILPLLTDEQKGQFQAALKALRGHKKEKKEGGEAPK